MQVLERIDCAPLLVDSLETSASAVVGGSELAAISLGMAPAPYGAVFAAHTWLVGAAAVDEELEDVGVDMRALAEATAIAAASAGDGAPLAVVDCCLAVPSYTLLASRM